MFHELTSTTAGVTLASSSLQKMFKGQYKLSGHSLSGGHKHTLNVDSAID